MSVLDSIREMIQKAKKILIITHENPDGDAVGSSLGFMHGLKKLDKEVDVFIPVVNKMFSFLPGFDLIKNELPEDSEYEHLGQLGHSGSIAAPVCFSERSKVGECPSLGDRCPASDLSDLR